MPVESVEANSANLSTVESLSHPAAYNKPAYIFMALLVLYVIVRGIRGAAFRPFWFDEIYTLTLADHTSIRGVWAAIMSGYDSQAPAFGLLEHFALLIPIKKEVALRLPSIFAFACTLICVFAYVKRRSGELIACVCALLFLSTSLFHTYLIEARSYGLMFACIAFALVCYQRLPSPRWTVMFAASLILAESLHYYAIFAMMPFWFAEAVVVLKERRFRWPVWLALVLGTMPLLAFLRLLLAQRELYGPGAWTRPELSAVRKFYGAFFLLTDNAFGLGLVAVAVASTIWARVWPGTGDGNENKQKTTDLSESVLQLGFVALPFIVFVLVRTLHGSLIARYVMGTIIGIVLGLACGLAVAGRRAVLIFGVFILTVVMVRESIFWRAPEIDPYVPFFSLTSRDQIKQRQALVEEAGHGDLPVVVSDNLLYTQLVYYSEPRFAKRLVFLADTQRELRFVGTAVDSRLMLSFRDRFPMQVLDYSQFIAAHKEFLLLREGVDWYLPLLAQDGGSVQLASLRCPLYLVTMKKAASSPEQ